MNQSPLQTKTDRYSWAEMLDLTAEIQREQNRKRHRPMWEAFWIGFLFGLLFMVSVIIFCWLRH